MKKIAMLSSILALVVLTTSGCGSLGKNLDKAVTALGKDNASFHLRVTSLYGSVDLSRANPSATNTLPHSVAVDGSITVGQTNK